MKIRQRIWRRGWDSNPRMEVLQTSPLGLLGTAPDVRQYIENGELVSASPEWSTLLTHRLLRLQLQNAAIRERSPNPRMAKRTGVDALGMRFSYMAATRYAKRPPALRASNAPILPAVLGKYKIPYPTQNRQSW